MSITYKPIDGTYAEIYEKVTGIKNFMLEYNPGKLINNFLYKDIAQKVLDTPVRKEDTWLVSFPRTGSTWCQEMIWLIGNNLDFDTAKNTLQHYRAPILETYSAIHEYIDVFKEKFTDSLDYINNLPSPRYIKTHLRSCLLPTELHKVKPKIIYVLRNPKDVCISYFHLTKCVYNIDIHFESFCELFLNDAVAYGGLFDHYFDFWNRRHESNILVLRYEEMVADTRGVLKQIADFMGKPLSEEDISALEEFVSFKNMRVNRACNTDPLLEAKNRQEYFKKTGIHFIRKGKVGDWKNYMSPEIARRFDEYIEKHTEGTDLSFD
ncbi:sulfotransferase 4A1-like [Anoplophora glabripennis]|uniref:sulfotransferase 4A1-like n=1 Tax=Anoplophora glabripennis TaxID=217634 RepID=UPI0008735D58|nr:sulfotransferase 4A1-like [Anoplophora glabripennis]